jgi:hypothetical protein
MLVAAGLYRDGVGLEKDPREVERWLLAAAEAGHPPAMTIIGYRAAEAYRAGEIDGLRFEKEGLPWLEQAAEAGQVQALESLAALRLEGIGVKKDPAAAARLYQKAARQGSALAMSQLAMMFREGVGVARSANEAQRWEKRAAAARAGTQ